MRRLIFLLVAGLCALLPSQVQGQNVKVIAHRGVHTEAPENSLASLRASQELGVWGSEFDIWITRDGECIINHNATFPNDSRVIKESRFMDLADIELPNGEAVPTFDDYLMEASEHPGIKLVCELKRHGSDSLNRRLFDTAWERVTSYGMEGRVVFQTFSYSLCRYAKKTVPQAKVYYLCSKEASLKTADELVSDGIDGANYRAEFWLAHPDWIADFHAKGLGVVVTAQDDPQIQRSLIEAGVDIIATNRPAELMKLLKEYEK